MHPCNQQHQPPLQGFELALADAEKCITLDPAWGKVNATLAGQNTQTHTRTESHITDTHATAQGYYRQAVALKGLRRLPEAVLAAAAAVEREPSSSQFTALKTELGGLDMASLASAEDADAEKVCVWCVSLCLCVCSHTTVPSNASWPSPSPCRTCSMH